MSIDGYRVYKYYMACKLHFTTLSYDIFEKYGKVKCNKTVFDKRNDVPLFNGIGSRFSDNQKLVTYLVSNFAYGLNPIYSIEESFENQLTWIKRRAMLTRLLEDDLDVICSKLSSYDSLEEAIFYSYIGKTISLESTVILNMRLKFIKTLNEKIPSMPMLFGEIQLRLKKAESFFNIDVEKIDRVINCKLGI